MRSAPVAQVDRATGFEPVGRGFESLRARQETKQLQGQLASRFSLLTATGSGTLKLLPPSTLKLASNEGEPDMPPLTSERVAIEMWNPHLASVESAYPVWPAGRGANSRPRSWAWSLRRCSWAAGAIWSGRDGRSCPEWRTGASACRHVVNHIAVSSRDSQEYGRPHRFSDDEQRDE